LSQHRRKFLLLLLLLCCPLLQRLRKFGLYDVVLHAAVVPFVKQLDAIEKISSEEEAAR